MLIISVIGILLDSVSGILYLYGMNVQSFYYLLLTKCIILFYVLWDLLMFSYIMAISYSGKTLSKMLTFNKLLILSLCIIVLVFPIEVVVEGNSAFPMGIAVVLMYVITALLVFSVIFILIRNFKNLKQKKYLPLFAYLLFGMVMLFLQSATGILLMTSVDVFITFLMYFTIENPDLKMIEQLNIARDQAEKANNAKTDFLSNMSHEIRTPLNAIIGFSQALLEEEIPPSAKEEVRDIVMASDNLLELVNGILDISKLEANKLEIVNTEYSLSKVLNDLVILTKARIGEKPIEFRTNFDPSAPAYLYGDYTRLKQIVLNLLTNAAKYTKEGYIEFKVSTVKKDDICRLIISVEDTGIGIQNDKIDKLFNKFERLDLDKNITIEGTGLGLAITKKLVDLMQGKIVVQSDYGHGSKFTVAIDQRIIATPTKPLDETPTVVDNVDITGTEILVVDDNKINLKVAERLLKDTNAIVTLVSSGIECIELLKTKTFDLILLDDMMPTMSGVDTFKKLKEDPNFKIPTVMMTANAIEGMKEKYLNEGFNDYLSKPINRKELNTILMKYRKKNNV